VQGLLFAVPRHPAAVAEDCARADVLLSPLRLPEGCTAPALLIDRRVLARAGAHALYLAPDPAGGKAQIARVETVASRRGERPWSTPAGNRAPQ
jgi:competence protein ComEC